LDGLDKQSMLEMLQHLGGRLSHDVSLVDRLSEATGGNPFFLLETLRTLAEAGASLDPAPGWLNIPLPDSVRQAVEMRVQRLSSTARQVLEAAAVLGLPFAFDTLHLTAGRQDMETVDGLDELVARQLLVERAGCYHFRHDMVRDAVASGLSTYRRRLLHRRAAEALRLVGDLNAATAHALQAVALADATGPAHDQRLVRRVLNSCSVETEGFETGLGVPDSRFLQNMSLDEVMAD